MRLFMSMNQTIVREREYIYNDETGLYLNNWYGYQLCAKKYATNFRKYWILKYVILLLAQIKMNKKLRIRKFIDYEPKYHCF